MQFVFQIIKFEIVNIGSEELELVKDRYTEMAAAFLLRLHIFGKVVAACIAFAGERIVARFARKESERSEELDFRSGVLLKQGLDAVVDTTALGIEVFLIVIVLCSIVAPTADCAIVREVIRRSPKDVDVVDSRFAHLLLEGMPLQS